MVEAVGDGLVPESFDDAPAERFRHDRTLDRMGFEAGLLEPLGPFGGDWVRDLEGYVPVWGLTDVVALLGVDLEAVPALFEHFDDVPLGHALFEPSGQDLGGGLNSPSSLGKLKRLV
ncbi:hypothetical protein NLX83_15820 [Allokutzneria sp. A3M-2-11 16]|nr:hypothetical protein [Allokutzneria sp. A3M-2-11 16]MCP3800735.1 hypothetical protein [Allokutzneria sp. A3M-2-11 16]